MLVGIVEFDTLFVHRLLPFSLPLGLCLFDNLKVFLELLSVCQLRLALFANLSNSRSKSFNLLHRDVNLLIHRDQRGARFFDLLFFVGNVLLGFGNIPPNFGMVLLRIFNVLFVLLHATAVFFELLLVLQDLFAGRINHTLEVEEFPEDVRDDSLVALFCLPSVVLGLPLLFLVLLDF